MAIHKDWTALIIYFSFWQYLFFFLREEEILKQHQEIDESLTAKIASLEQARDAVNSARWDIDWRSANRC